MCTYICVCVCVWCMCVCVVYVCVCDGKMRSLITRGELYTQYCEAEGIKLGEMHRSPNTVKL